MPQTNDTHAALTAVTALTAASDLTETPIPDALPWDDQAPEIAASPDVPASWFADEEAQEEAAKAAPAPTTTPRPEPRKPTARASRVPKAAATPRRPKLSELPHERPVCLCGCGETTGGPTHRPSRFRAGHDARAKGAAQRAHRGQPARDGDTTLAHGIATWNERHADLPKEHALPEDATWAELVEAWNPLWPARFLTDAPVRASRAKAKEDPTEAADDPSDD